LYFHHTTAVRKKTVQSKSSHTVCGLWKGIGQNVWNETVGNSYGKGFPKHLIKAIQCLYKNTKLSEGRATKTKKICRSNS
jgi:hypothetical protein